MGAGVYVTQHCKSVNKVKSICVRKEAIPVNTDERLLLH